MRSARAYLPKPRKTMRGPSVMPRLSPTEGASLGRGIVVRSTSADASGESLDGSATPLRCSFLGEYGDGGLAGRRAGNRRGGMSNDIRSVARARADALE